MRPKQRYIPKDCSDIRILTLAGFIKGTITQKELKALTKKNKAPKPVKLKLIPPDDRQSERYNKWRADVMARDKYRCVLCESTERLEAHHIIRWVDDPKKRFDQSNGVSLCYVCHQKGHNYNKEPFPKLTTDVLKRYIAFKHSKRKMETNNQTDYNADKPGNSRANKTVPRLSMG